MLAFIGDLFENFPIRQVYKSSSALELEEYLTLPLVDMCVYNMMIRGHSHKSTWAQGGSCENWSLFFLKLFEFIGAQGVNVELIGFPNFSDHVFITVDCKWKKYIIDIFSKWNYVVKELILGDAIYIGTKGGRDRALKIVNIFPLSLEDDATSDLLNWVHYTPEYLFKTISENTWAKLIRIVTYWPENERIDFGIYKIENEYKIAFAGVELTIKAEVFESYLDGIWENATSFEFLLRFCEGKIDEKQKNTLSYICELFTLQELKLRLISKNL